MQKLKLPGGTIGLVGRRAGFLEVVVAPDNVRLPDDAVAASWGPSGKREGVV